MMDTYSPCTWAIPFRASSPANPVSLGGSLGRREATGRLVSATCERATVTIGTRYQQGYRGRQG
jgi:hypothetical protein